MGLRIGAGFRLSRHVWIGASAPLGHGRRLAAHRGYFDLLGMVVGLAIMGVPAGVLGAGVGRVGSPFPVSKITQSAAFVGLACCSKSAASSSCCAASRLKCRRRLGNGSSSANERKCAAISRWCSPAMV
jgi:hypothetical protein